MCEKVRQAETDREPVCVCVCFVCFFFCFFFMLFFFVVVVVAVFVVVFFGGGGGLKREKSAFGPWRVA